MCCKAETVLSIILGIIDICGLVSDWLFFAELQVTEKGLVYGPEDEKVLNALLAFCVIGTAIFIFEGVSHIYSLCSDSGKECINTDLISFLAVLFGDIPQVSISVYVAYCREDGVSYFQLAKAVFVFLGESMYYNTRTYLQNGSWSNVCVFSRALAESVQCLTFRWNLHLSLTVWVDTFIITI